ncbi:MAG: hypothetical protein H7144_09960, partial [Burkholderiales bacterium]|nr:hypothetical protein [Phycisphaerae bacterium]
MTPTKSSIVAAAVTLVGVLGSINANAATVVQSGSGVQAYFGSQSNAYTASNPVVGGWGVPGFGVYPAGAVLPGLPPAPTSITFPTYTGNNFQGAGSISNFNDLAPGTTFTVGNSTIADSYLPVASQVE